MAAVGLYFPHFHVPAARVPFANAVRERSHKGSRVSFLRRHSCRKVVARCRSPQESQLDGRLTAVMLPQVTAAPAQYKSCKHGPSSTAEVRKSTD